MDARDDAAYARAPEPEDVVRVCRSLNDCGARYLLIGGFAVIAHGAARFTKDLDLLVDDHPENIQLVKQALSVLADNAAADVGLDDVRTYVVVRVADEIVVDLMGRACGVSYAEAVDDAERLEMGGVMVPVASPAALMRMKNTYRPQDQMDRDYLEALIRDRQS